MEIYNGILLDKGDKQYFREYLLAKIDLPRFHDYTEKSRVLKNTDVGVKVHYIRVTTTLTECN